MTEVLHSPSSSSSPSISTPTHGAALFHQTQSYVGDEGISGLRVGDDVEEESQAREKREKDRRDQLSLLALLVTLLRKSFWSTCKTDRDNFSSRGSCRGGVMEIDGRRMYSMLIMSHLTGLMGSWVCLLNLSPRFLGGLPVRVPLFLEFLPNLCSCLMISVAIAFQLSSCFCKGICILKVVCRCRQKLFMHEWLKGFSG